MSFHRERERMPRDVEFGRVLVLDVVCVHFL